MLGKRCSLCGGKIVHGRCVDCGLDATKNDTQYKLNQSSCDHEPLTHVHANEKETPLYEPEEQFNRETTYKPETYKPETYGSGDNNKKQKKIISQWRQLENTPRNREIVKESKKKSKRGIIIAIVIVIVSLLGEGIGSFVNFVEDTVNQVTDGASEFAFKPSNQSYEEAGDYQYVTRELSATGETYEMTLTSGYYEVGAQIPEGTYSLVVESGTGRYTLMDRENGIFLYESMSDDSDYEDELTECDDVRMYTGAWLQVTDNLQLKITSSNAQTSDMIQLMDNPNTEEITLGGMNKTTTVNAGVTFPGGVYDIEVLEGYGSIDFFIPDHTYTDEDTKETYSTGSIYMDMDNEYGANVYRNVSIPEGSKLEFTDLEIQLTPTEQISSTDYLTMWDVID